MSEKESKEKGYTVEITVRSGDRVLDRHTHYSGDDYVDFVMYQGTLAKALTGAGFDRAAVELGEAVPQEFKAYFGIK